jgi:hypothetical protein
MMPPKLAALLLVVVAGEAESEFLAGDLHEEFIYLCAIRGRRIASRWYVWQVLRSVFSLLRLRLRSGEALQIGLAVLGVSLPLMLLDRLWCFVHSQIPLKDGLDRAPWFLAVNLVYACACAALCGSMARNFERAMLIAAAASASAAFALWTAVGAEPAVYVCLVLLLVPSSSLFAFTWRKSV